MEAIGRLAGGVAHDFNNLLMIISSYVFLANELVESRGQVSKYLQSVTDAVEKASSLTKQLLVFSRKQIKAHKALDLNETVQSFCNMLPRVLGEDIELQVIVDRQQSCVVYADKGQVEQVVMNLVVNARDAMPDGGGLTISIVVVDLSAKAFSARNVQPRPGTYARLSIEDTGVGMDEEIASHIFDPFFTTKEPGKGTGLGLSTVYAIVKESNGYIWVESHVAEGTRFDIYLPCFTGEDRVGPAQEEGRTTSLPGTETVLLVEDEAALRAAIAEYLQLLGYNVVEAGDPASALQIVTAKESSHFDLLLTDLVMPGMNGVELSDRVRALRPTIKTIYMSGFSERTVELEESQRPLTLLTKPFSLSALAGIIRRVIESAPV
jgi:CheY-like chemotaxis protein